MTENNQSNQENKLQDDRILTADEARQWLDDFLVEQQEKEA